MKRSNAIGILLSKLPPIHEIVAAVKTLDDGVLSADLVEGLQQQLPPKEEIAAVRAEDAQDVTWDKPERLVLALDDIPQVGDRLRTWQVLKDFDQRAASTQQKASVLLAALDQIRTSRALSAVMGVTLTVGNFMNHGHLRGNARGFDVSTLPMLKSTLDNARQHSLLHYLLSICKSTAPQALKLPQELAAVKDAAKISPDSLHADIKALHVGAGDVASFFSSLDPHDPSSERLRAFVEAAESKIEAVEGLVVSVMNRYKHVLLYLGKREVETEASSDQFAEIVAIFDNFISDVENEIKSGFTSKEEGGGIKAFRNPSGGTAPSRLRRFKTQEEGQQGGALSGSGSSEGGGRPSHPEGGAGGPARRNQSRALALVVQSVLRKPLISP